ncbi:MAG: 1-acyl-sn-glycerol-3-phosphate acyltransferase [Candidatus Competibacteraceae bacterium]|nr:1-acyl-sn-glycerol-3-phosphate acyltransferase [Candidatus Competibacteraceae bacterium]
MMASFPLASKSKPPVTTHSPNAHTSESNQHSPQLRAHPRALDANCRWKPGLVRAGRRSVRTPLLILHILAGVLIAAALGPGRRHYVSTRPLVWWSRGLCRILGVRLRVQGTPHPAATLFVANHLSWLDIFCIAAVCPTHFLAKQEVAHWPLFGWLCQRAGTAFIRRGGDHGASEALERLVWRLRKGERILVFPEGTSTTGESVRRFFPRLFQAAILARCPVQAIALRYPHSEGVHPIIPFVGDAALLPHLWQLLGESGIVAELYFGTVHSAPHTSRDALARLTHTEISQRIAA